MRLFYLALAAGFGVLVGVAIYAGQAILHDVTPAKQLATKVDQSQTEGESTVENENNASHGPSTGGTGEKRVAAKSYSSMHPDEYRAELPQAFQSPQHQYASTSQYASSSETAGSVMDRAAAVTNDGSIGAPPRPPLPVPSTSSSSSPFSSSSSPAPSTSPSDTALRADAPALKTPVGAPPLPEPPHSGVKYHVTKTDGVARTKTIVNK